MFVVHAPYKCIYRITGSNKTHKVRTLGCARRSPPIDPRPNLAKISRTNSTNSQHKWHKIYTGSGHRCGVIPYSSVVVDCLLGWGWTVQGEEQPPEVEVFLCSVGVPPRMWWLQSQNSPPLATVVASSIYSGLGPLPKYWAGREPTTANLKGVS